MDVQVKYNHLNKIFYFYHYSNFLNMNNFCNMNNFLVERKKLK